jgi:tetratricopeptide (TPR) repeat protein
VNRLLLEDAFPNEIAKRPKPEDAIAEYKKALAMNPNDQSSYKAIASLYENLQRTDDWLDWVTKRRKTRAFRPSRGPSLNIARGEKEYLCERDNGHRGDKEDKRGRQAGLQVRQTRKAGGP